VSEGITFGNVDFIPYREAKFDFVTVLKHTLFRSLSTVKMVYDSLFGLFSGRYGVEAVSGPVGITKVVGQAAQYGLTTVLNLVVVISINLGVMNLLPIPALDGGHIFIYLIEVVRRKPMKRELEGIINFVGLVLMLALAVLVAIKDIIAL
jgi:regulator of sigma E protease